MNTLMPNPARFQAPIKFCLFQYGEVKIKEATYIMGTPYFTRRAIGEWLGYEHPQQAIRKIIERNPYIENPAWATVVNLTTVEGDRTVTRSVEIYHPIALQLIVFESRQPRAIEYKIAVAKLVFDIMSGEYNRNLIRAYLKQGAPHA